MLQASGSDGVAFDPISFRHDGLTTHEVDVGWLQVADALVVPEMTDAARLFVTSVIDAGDGKLADEQMIKHLMAAADIAEELSL